MNKVPRERLQRHPFFAKKRYSGKRGLQRLPKCWRKTRQKKILPQYVKGPSNNYN